MYETVSTCDFGFHGCMYAHSNMQLHVHVYMYIHTYAPVYV